MRKHDIRSLNCSCALRSRVRSVGSDEERLIARFNAVDGIVDRTRHKGTDTTGDEWVGSCTDGRVVHDVDPVEDRIGALSGEGGDSTGKQRSDSQNDSEIDK